MAHAAWAESLTAATAWRAIYGIPINDPRAEITEQEAIYDLLVRHYVNERSPEAAAKRVAEDPAMRAAYAAAARSVANDPAYLRALERAERDTLNVQIERPR